MTNTAPRVKALIDRATKLKEEADRFLANAGDPSQSLAILANHGDLALQLLPQLVAALEPQEAEPVAFVPKRVFDGFDVNGTEIVEALLCPKGTLRPDNQVALYAHPAPVPASEKAAGLPDDLFSHRDEWRRGLVFLRDAAACDPLIYDKAYWQHEIDAFDRVFAALSHPVQGWQDEESLSRQIERLGDFIMREVPGEPSQSEGAVDTAIRWMRSALSQGWQTMNSAPKDRTRKVLAWRETEALSAHIELGYWSDSKVAWVNTYGHAFSSSPDLWFLPPIPFAYCNGCDGYNCSPEKGCAYPDTAPLPAGPSSKEGQ